MARALLLLWCTTIVAVFPLRPAAAAPLVASVPVTSAVAAVAERLDMDPVRDRAGFLPEIVRRIYSPPPIRQVPPNLAQRESATAGPLPRVDVPLSPEFWASTIFRRSIQPDQLLVSILADRRAALLARGLWAADDETLMFFSEHPSLLAFLYEHAAPAFTAFASSLRVRAGRMVVPGGAEAEPLWEAVVRARVSDPDAFMRALFAEPEWRTAYLYDVIATARPESQQFVIGAWIDDLALRMRRFAALATAVHTHYREWRVEELPFARPLNDLAILLLRIEVGPGGEPSPPNDRGFWASALNANPALDAADPAPPAHALIDAAWLVQATGGDMYTRGDRLDQLAFGQRVFGNLDDPVSESASAIVRELPTRRMLLLSLERLGIRDAAVYAAALQQARAAGDGGGDRFWTLAQLQGAFALVVRMSVVGMLTPADAAALTQSLFQVPLAQGEFRGALADWLQGELAQRLPRGATLEARVIAAVGGGATPGRPRVEWEGQRYLLDLAYAERQRITDIRSRQGGPGLDLALALASLARECARAGSPDAIRAVSGAVRQLLTDSGPLLARSRSEAMPPGVSAPRDGREWLSRVSDELDRAAAAGDSRRAARAGESLLGLADVTLAQALLSLVYAVHLGDPEGPALLGANVAFRHDFGFGRRDPEGRARGPWALPRQDFQPGVPWHVTGSLVGLDIALAPLALHRLSMDGLATPPRLQSSEREAIAVNVALLNARQLDDISRDRLLARVQRGRLRVRTLASAGAVELGQLERDLALDGWRGRTVRWVLQNDPRSVENQFSLAELATLGGTDALPDAWGSSGLLSFGCLCTRFPAPRTWRILSGRTQMAMMAASNVEMTLEMAQRLAALRLPAALLPSVLETAMQDFVDQVNPADSSDFAALVHYPRALHPNAIEDYVAAAATLAGPLVAADTVDGSEP
jgi:hypothetical protein